MGDYQQILKAKQVLELPERVSMEQIKVHYRTLLKRYHPDSCREDKALCEEKTRELVAAYELVQRFCASYHYSFAEEELRRFVTDENWWSSRFGNDPVWK